MKRTFLAVACLTIALPLGAAAQGNKFFRGEDDYRARPD